NGYYGARFAGRIASLMIEKYINDNISRKDLENWVLTHSLENEYLKPFSGKAFKINAEAQYQVIELPAQPHANNQAIEVPKQTIEIPLDETN
ncbi:MAG: hypothetical protein ACPGRW_09750, partial [Flavobacteriaceae bacterium]